VSNLRAPTLLVKPRGRVRLTGTLYLLAELVRRDFRSRFAGSALGVAWAVLQPLSLVILYWFVFTRILSAGKGIAGQNYPLFLISGLLPWIGFSEGVIRSVTSLTENAPLVRKLAIRSEILVVVPNVSAILFELIAIALFTVVLIFRGAGLSGLWLLPFCIAIQLGVQVGISWFLASMHVMLRDVGQIVGFVLSILFYLSPILYPATGRFENAFAWNPMTPLLGLFRSALIGSPLPAGTSVVFLVSVAATLVLGGLAFLRRLQPVLSDLL